MPVSDSPANGHTLDGLHDNVHSDNSLANSAPAATVLGSSKLEPEQLAPKPMGLSEYVEEELARSGTCSAFQMRYTIYLGLPWLLCGMQTMLHVFVTLPAERQVCLASNTQAGEHCTAIDVENCTVPKELYEYVSASHTLVAEFGLICDEEYKVPLLSTGFFLGFLFGVGFFANISDNRGRKAAFTFAIGFMQLGALLSTIAPTYFAYAAARLCIGAGVGGMGLTSFVWNSEVLGPQSRCILAATSNGIFAVGVLCLPFLATVVPGWRALSLCIFILGLPVVGLCCLEESPKWLATAGRSEEAHIVLLRIAAANKLEPPAAPPAGKDEPEAPVSSLPPAAGSTSILQDFLCDRRLSRRFVVLCFTWFSLSVAYYGLSMSVSNLGWDVNLAVIISQLTELPVYVPAIPLVDSHFAGRRGTIVGSLLLAGCCCLLAAAGSQQPAAAEGATSTGEPSLVLIILVYVGKAGISLAFTVVYLYAAELFPTDVRSRAMGLQSLCSRIGGMMAPIIADVGRHSMSLALVLFGIPSLLSGLLLLTLAETRGARIPDSIEDVPEPMSLLSCCGRSYEHLDEQPVK